MDQVWFCDCTTKTIRSQTRYQTMPPSKVLARESAVAPSVACPRTLSPAPSCSGAFVPAVLLLGILLSQILAWLSLFLWFRSQDKCQLLREDALGPSSGFPCSSLTLSITLPCWSFFMVCITSEHYLVHYDSFSLPTGMQALP